MAEQIYSIPENVLRSATVEQPGGDVLETIHASAEARPLTGQWRGSDGEGVGEEFPIDVAPPAIIEFPDRDGSFTGARVPGGVTFSTTTPPQAAALRITSVESFIAELPVAAAGAAAASLPPPKIYRIGDPAASLVIPTFAERFTDENKFFNCVSQLHEWVLGQEPFDDPQIAKRLAFDGHYWPSDPQRGLFNTLDANIIDGRLFYGDRALARRLLARWTGAGVSLILIDSALRGGAGGQAGYSAWVSIAAAPGEDWEAVCLHEVGHALGLADEYVDAMRESEWPNSLEPNVSRNARPSQTPWNAFVNVADNPAPTVAFGHAAPHDDMIGTFQGARYRKDLYRAAETCLMKETASGFCPACVSHIRNRLLHG